MIEIHAAAAEEARAAEYVTVSLSGQEFGIPISEVYDILGDHRITEVALASREIAGVMNIRGRIVTAIDVRHRLGQPSGAAGDAPRAAAKSMNVVVHHKGEPYALVVDSVGEVLAVEMTSFEKNPPNMNAAWAGLCRGVHRLDRGLLVVLDVEQLVGGVAATIN